MSSSGARRLWVSIALVALLSAARPARATYSIAAVDLASGQAGGAGTSCVGSQLSVYEIFGAATGFGVVMAQAAINTSARDRAVQLLLQGADAPYVLEQITAPGFDFFFASRQYAVIDARGMAAGFTGDATSAYADDVQGRAGQLVYSVQGNILTGAAVLEQASAVFNAPGCDLADTLMRALEAGAMNGQGDSRCTGDGIPSDGAFLRVDLPDAASTPWLELQIDDTAPQNPIVALRVLYEAWRIEHPCPMAAPEDAGTAMDAAAPDPLVDASTPQAGSAASDPIVPAPAVGTGGVSGASAGVQGGVGGGAGGAGGATPAMPSTITRTQERTGGGCAIGRREAGASTVEIAWGAVLVLMLIARRRRA